MGTRFANPEKTAISRQTLSLPARELRSRGLLKGRILDYGCGRGRDVAELGCEGYDPCFAPQEPEGLYDTVLCTYVLNVVSQKTQRDILGRIRALLAPGGRAYVSVRRDLPREGSASQRYVRLKSPVVRETASVCIYEVTCAPA